MMSEPFDPVLGVSLSRLICDFLQDGVKRGVARFRLIQKEQGIHVRVDARLEREFCENSTDDGAVQVPAGHRAKVAAFFVEQHQDEFFQQTERLDRNNILCDSHFPLLPINVPARLSPLRLAEFIRDTLAYRALKSSESVGRMIGAQGESRKGDTYRDAD